MSQILTVVSPLPLTSLVPSGLKQSPETNAEWPVSVSCSAPVSAFQTMISPGAFVLWSPQPVATHFPSGLKTTLLILNGASGVSVSFSFPVLLSQIFTSPARLRGEVNWNSCC